MNAKKAKGRDGRIGSEKDDPSVTDSYRLAQQVGGAHQLRSTNRKNTESNCSLVLTLFNTV